MGEGRLVVAMANGAGICVYRLQDVMSGNVGS